MLYSLIINNVEHQPAITNVAVTGELHIFPNYIGTILFQPIPGSIKFTLQLGDENLIEGMYDECTGITIHACAAYKQLCFVWLGDDERLDKLNAFCKYVALVSKNNYSKVY